MKKTEQLGLSLPEGNDYVNIETLNENWRKIDAAFPELIGLIEGRAQVVSGSYVGTGTYGEDNPTQLEFLFQPKLVMVSGGNTRGTTNLLWHEGVSEVQEAGYTSSIPCSRLGNTVSWYSDTSASRQYNSSGSVYIYVAIG